MTIVRPTYQKNFGLSLPYDDPNASFKKVMTGECQDVCPICHEKSKSCIREMLVII